MLIFFGTKTVCTGLYTHMIGYQENLPHLWTVIIMLSWSADAKHPDSESVNILKLENKI